MIGYPENYDLLIARIKQGDNTAWQQLHDLLFKHIFAYALQEGGDQQLAEDAIQEGFIVIFVLKDSLMAFEDVRRMLFIVVRNKCRDYKRANKYQERFIEDYFVHLQSEERLSNSPLDKFEIKRAIDKLPSSTRTIMELSYFHGYTLNQIASIMQLSKPYVRNRRIAGRKKLLKLLAKDK